MEETGALQGVLAAVRDGLSGVLVLRGEAGVGKTALLEWAAGQVGEMQVAPVAGVQREMDLGFAGLHRLLVPFLRGLEALPVPQRQALRSAFGLVARTVARSVPRRPGGADAADRRGDRAAGAVPDR